MLVLVFGSACCLPAIAQDLPETRALFQTGKYLECIAACDKEIETTWRVDWSVLKTQSQLKLGKYKDAVQTVEQGLKDHASDIRIRWIGRDVYRLNNQLKNADLMLAQIDQLVKNSPWRYSDAEDRIVLGLMMLEANADARKVLELFFDSAKRVQPGLVDNYIVAADLALSKSDNALAVKECEKGLKLHPEHPELHFRLAMAQWDANREQAAKALARTLSLNPRHDGALLFQSSRMIDMENYEGALAILKKIHSTNPKHELAFAHMAIISHLKGDYQQEEVFRKKALSSWSRNHLVDYTIGKKLSRKYRFQEAAGHQRQALEFAPNFVPAKIQLAQDLLRLGEDKTGWELVAEANQLDQYNLLMHNLQTLHDEISSYSSLKQDGIVVRMTARESRLYGPEVLELLVTAKKQLCKKYEYQFEKPVIVEIFPRQSDFAIRTFGIPGGAGFLGVCFGHLITANSPATQTANPTNWQSVLWHEFCHAVTLGKTKNRMPRWLSEGISVYEERQRNAGSGERISPVYQKMLTDELTPVSQLSGAFLQAKSPMHLQFAYFESSLVVEYIIQEYGIDVLKKILVDLGAGISINESLQRYTGSLKELDEKFKQHAIRVAKSYAAELDFNDPKELTAQSSPEELQTYLKAHPNNFTAQLLLAAARIREKKYNEASRRLKELADQFQPDAIPVTVLKLHTKVHQLTQQPDREIETINQAILVSDDELSLYKRLMELHYQKQNWREVKRACQSILAINPLQIDPYRKLARAGEKLQDPAITVRALECLLEFDTSDIAASHYRIARIHFGQGNLDRARRHVLYALEEAPRYRDALKLLLEIRAKQKPVSGKTNDSN